LNFQQHQLDCELIFRSQWRRQEFNLLDPIRRDKAIFRNGEVCKVT